MISVANVDELVEVLGRELPITRIRLAAGEYDLTSRNRSFNFVGNQFELIGSTLQPTRLKLACGATANEQINGQLSIKASKVLLQNIWLELVNPLSVFERLAGRSENGLIIREASRIDLMDCIVLPPQSSRNTRLKAIAIGQQSLLASNIHLERCLFGSGCIGMGIPSSSTVTIDDSAFASSLAAIHIDDAAVKNELDLDTGDIGRLLDSFHQIVVDSRFSRCSCPGRHGRSV